MADEITSRRFQGYTDGEKLTQATLNAEDCIQARHDIGGSGDSDKGIPFKIIKSGYIAVCTTAASTVDKVITVQNFPDFKLVNGIEVSVYFKYGNEATTPTFNVNGTGIIAAGLENQASSVSIGSGCWGAGVWLTLRYQKVTVDGTNIEKWIIKGHNIAQQNTSSNSGYTLFSDGTSVYPSSHFDVNNFVQPIICANSSGTATLSKGVWVGITSTAGGSSGMAMFFVLIQNSTTKYAARVIGSSSATITYSGAEITTKWGSIGLPTNWIQINNKYWLS